MNCLVTGGSRGIGLAVAERLAKQGWGITLCASSAERLSTARSKLAVVREGQIHHTWALDLADLDAVAGLQGAPAPLSEYGAFVNSAGIAGHGLSVTQSASAIDRTLKINLHAPILLARAVVKAMIRAKTPEHKHLVFLSSVLGHRGYAGSTVYAATKAGIEGYARALAREVGSRNIAVNCVAPGLSDTEMGRGGSAKLMENNAFPGLVPVEEVVKAVDYLMTTTAVTGETIIVDNGASI